MFGMAIKMVNTIGKVIQQKTCVSNNGNNEEAKNYNEGS